MLSSGGPMLCCVPPWEGGGGGSSEYLQLQPALSSWARISSVWE